MNEDCIAGRRIREMNEIQEKRMNKEKTIRQEEEDEK